ncbi:hypothetical protein LTR36_008968 [Oleoguttula mirabilis]|uniref:Uncharacterized protein n=1 Tax=Oleoguttula mirabilis TaxID=1507867 RepID=A0AAV9J7U2_9PEZI|nr:hypothetical protein LTR36_008968 [Oleoguttula mirabilis]
MFNFLRNVFDPARGQVNHDDFTPHVPGAFPNEESSLPKLDSTVPIAGTQQPEALPLNSEHAQAALNQDDTPAPVADTDDDVSQRQLEEATSPSSLLVASSADSSPAPAIIEPEASRLNTTSTPATILSKRDAVDPSSMRKWQVKASGMNPTTGVVCSGMSALPPTRKRRTRRNGNTQLQPTTSTLPILPGPQVPESADEAGEPEKAATANELEEGAKVMEPKKAATAIEPENVAKAVTKKKIAKAIKPEATVRDTSLDRLTAPLPNARNETAHSRDSVATVDKPSFPMARLNMSRVIMQGPKHVPSWKGISKLRAVAAKTMGGNALMLVPGSRVSRGFEPMFALDRDGEYWFEQLSKVLGGSSLEPARMVAGRRHAARRRGMSSPPRSLKRRIDSLRQVRPLRAKIIAYKAARSKTPVAWASPIDWPACFDIAEEVADSDTMTTHHVNGNDREPCAPGAEDESMTELIQEFSELSLAARVKPEVQPEANKLTGGEADMGIVDGGNGGRDAAATEIDGSTSMPATTLPLAIVTGETTRPASPESASNGDGSLSPTSLNDSGYGSESDSTVGTIIVDEQSPSSIKPSSDAKLSVATEAMGIAGKTDALDTPVSAKGGADGGMAATRDTAVETNTAPALQVVVLNEQSPAPVPDLPHRSDAMEVDAEPAVPSPASVHSVQPPSFNFGAATPTTSGQFSFGGMQQSQQPTAILPVPESGLNIEKLDTMELDDTQKQTFGSQTTPLVFGHSVAETGLNFFKIGGDDAPQFKESSMHNDHTGADLEMSDAALPNESTAETKACRATADGQEEAMGVDENEMLDVDESRVGRITESRSAEPDLGDTEITDASNTAGHRGVGHNLTPS